MRIFGKDTYNDEVTVKKKYIYKVLIFSHVLRFSQYYQNSTHLHIQNGQLDDAVICVYLQSRVFNARVFKCISIGVLQEIM